MSLFPLPRTRAATFRGAGEEADRLRRIASILEHARHPGVPELLDLRTDGPVAELDIALPDGAPLNTLALSLEEVAGVGATIATTVADLHDIGVAVGALAADTVIVTNDGHAVLTDFSRSTRLGAPHAKWPDDPRVVRDDRDLGALLGDLLDRCTPPLLADALEARPRWSRARGRVTPCEKVRRLAERASDGALRSRQLAEALATDVPGVCLPRRRDTNHDAPGPVPIPVPDDRGCAFETWFDDSPPRRTADRRRVRVSLALACACVPACIALVALLHAVTTAPASPCAHARSLCASYRAGVLSVNGTRYAVGGTGDVAVVGRWWCMGPSLALLQPATGKVWLYRAWPSATQPVTPVLGATAVAGRALATRPDGTCDDLFVVSADGRRVPVHIPSVG